MGNLGITSRLLSSEGGNQQDKTKDSFNITESLLTGDVGPKDPFIGSRPLGSVITKEYMGKQKESAGFITNMVAGLADDPQTQIRVYAASRFPNLPEPERLKRYGIHNNEVVYMGDDGSLYRETADTWWQRIKRFAAQTGSHAPAIAMGVIGAVVGPGTAALGAAGGEGIRKSIAGTVLKEPQTTMGNIASMALEGATAGAGEIAGRGVVRGLNRLGAMRGGKIATAAGQRRGEIDIPKTKDLRRIAEEMGIDLSAAETTGSKALVDKYNLLGDLPATADLIRADRLKRIGQIEISAEKKLLPRISPKKESVTKIGEDIVAASKKAVEKPVKVRRAKASPLYKKAFEESPPFGTTPIKNDLASVFKDSLSGSAEDKAFNRLSKMIPEKKMSLKQVDTFKKEIDKILGDFTKDPRFAVDKGVKNKLLKFKKALLKQADETSPTYARARKIFGEYSEEVEKRSVKTLIGRISKLEGDQKLKAVKELFKSTDSYPEVIARIKKQVTEQSPEVWNKAVRQHIEEVFDSVTELATDDIYNLGGMFRKKLFGSKKRREILKAAVDPGQFKALENFMEVMQRTGLIMKKESATATRQVLIQELGAQAGEGLAGKIIRAQTRPLYTKTRIVGDWFRKMNTLIKQGKADKELRKLVDVLLSGDAAKQLEKMIQLSPRSVKLIPQFATFLGLTTKGEVSRKRAKSRDVLPPALQPPLRNRLRPIRTR